MEERRFLTMFSRNFDFTLVLCTRVKQNSHSNLVREPFILYLCFHLCLFTSIAMCCSHTHLSQNPTKILPVDAPVKRGAPAASTKRGSMAVGTACTCNASNASRVAAADDPTDAAPAATAARDNVASTRASRCAAQARASVPPERSKAVTRALHGLKKVD